MKLMRVGEPGRERPALLDGDGVIRDLSDIVDDIAGDVLSPAGLARLAALDTASLPAIDPAIRIGACVGGVQKFACVGLNYADHAAEAGMPVPDEPVLFGKAISALCGPNDEIEQPVGSTKLDYEVELAVIIGTRAKNVTEAEAMDHVAGFAVFNDVSEREFQIHRGGQWIKGKSHDTFGPLGPWLVTRDEAGDIGNLGMFLDVNGGRRQTGSTRTMIFGVAHLVSYISRFMTLEPGDVIPTGTPPGVALGMKEPAWLKPGDVVELGIDGLGRQRQVVVPAA
ncbi:fumarylacetoacetate hydrolase family protein [Limibaculum sp. M0105]|uniref:Fumarylacetoacetate hydrolase family protein n=1 Tax=Thermohalobaculum xanthum TaxID=2753746 RepID=A0A8J7M3I4_9RHOB|nr:fumarylacetoacetate hydrolase family protein [Thermohalobaculum xanthum]MBK0397641.1 fumarylacetoacetate hydrolase family protein [Thermohalobaculum xanthum]